MSSDLVLEMQGVAKSYPRKRRPGRELWSRLWGHAPEGDRLHALSPLDLRIRRGESVGIIGLNGAGKSTLLQIASGVLTPSSGQVRLHGRVAALLELGAGFDPEASGLDNIQLYATTLGLSPAEVRSRLDDIIEFSGLRPWMDAPVKTYSSGMQVRLAFSVATAVQPDLLIVDEALSVGDGAFAKKSFDRIMSLRQQGTALLLSSHALFHVDLFCARTLWLHQGAIRALGETARVLPAYQEFLDADSLPTGAQADTLAVPADTTALSVNAVDDARVPTLPAAPDPSHVRLIRATASLDGQRQADMQGRSGLSTLRVAFELQASQEEPSPRAAVVISSDSGRIIGSALSPPGLFTPCPPALFTPGPPGSFTAAKSLPAGLRSGSLTFELPALPLNQGRYRVGVYVLCSQGHFVYAWSDPHVHITLEHSGVHQGPWLMPGTWDPSAPESVRA